MKIFELELITTYPPYPTPLRVPGNISAVHCTYNITGFNERIFPAQV